MTYTHRAFGLTLRSCLRLPAPAARPGSQTEVTVRYAPVDRELRGATWQHGPCQASPRALLLSIDGVARYLVSDGQDIAIDRHSRASDDDVRLYLLASPFGALLHQRDDLVLHGSAVRVGRSAVAFLGESGSGKSTLAAELRTRGFGVLTDDLCVIRTQADARLAQPGLRQVKLCQDALDRLAIPAHRLRRVGARREKRAWPVTTGFASRALPVGRFYVLNPVPTDAVRLSPLTGPERFKALLDHTFRLSFLEGLGTRRTHFAHALAVARSTPVIAVHRPAARFCVDELADRLVADFAAQRGRTPAVLDDCP